MLKHNYFVMVSVMFGLARKFLNFVIRILFLQKLKEDRIQDWYRMVCQSSKLVINKESPSWILIRNVVNGIVLTKCQGVVYVGGTERTLEKKNIKAHL